MRLPQASWRSVTLSFFPSDYLARDAPTLGYHFSSDNRTTGQAATSFARVKPNRSDNGGKTYGEKVSN